MSSQNNPKTENNLEVDLIISELRYLQESAFNANEDRARTYQFFFVIIGTFIAAIFSSQLKDLDPKMVYIAFFITFLILSLMGVFTILQLYKLRLTWLDSVKAMNSIKKELVSRYPNIAGCFVWNESNIPPAFKGNSVSFYLASVVSLLSGFAFGSAIAFLFLYFKNIITWVYVIPLGLVFAFILLFFCYYFPLKR